MVKLAPGEVKTKEVLDWKGLHLLHFGGSSCSQKTRIALAVKNVAWESHYVDISRFENFTEWFMGINPRGLVPVLVHDGDVHIESNDIIEYIDATFDGPALFPADPDERAHMAASMKREDDLHLSLRTLTFRYLLPVEMMRKDDGALDVYESEGATTVGGETDTRKSVEVDFWRRMNADNGITDERCVAAIGDFKAAFAELEDRLAAHEWLLASGFSALDIAWWITAFRVTALGFPTERYPHLHAWHERLAARDDFAREVAMPPEAQEKVQAHMSGCAAGGKAMADLIAANAL